MLITYGHTSPKPAAKLLTFNRLCKLSHGFFALLRQVFYKKATCDAACRSKAGYIIRCDKRAAPESQGGNAQALTTL